MILATPTVTGSVAWDCGLVFLVVAVGTLIPAVCSQRLDREEHDDYKQ